MGRDALCTRHVSDQSHRLQNALRPGQRRVRGLRRVLHRHPITARRVIPALAALTPARARNRLHSSTSTSKSTITSTTLGWVTEWLIVHAWKACVPKGTGGSNPPPSAIVLRAARFARSTSYPTTRFSRHAHPSRIAGVTSASFKARRVNPKNILTELKRRNVYRAAVAYGVVAWFLTQLTTQVFPFFEIPNSAVRFVVIALAVGFPIAMLLSWIYELTPEGVVRTEDLDPVEARSVQRRSGRLLDFIIIVALLLIIAMLVVGRLPFHRQTGESISQKSIAVLPFENLSEDKANAYFADGIQDEILTRLSKIADLKVISRTSTQHYKSAPENLPEIARQLGVAHILEGRVQKSGDAVRVNVQLIQAANDSHLWADTFDRKLTDIFSVESEVAKAIAEQLRAHLSGREEQEIAAKPTDNPEAYDAYLRGLAYTLKTATTPANALGAQKYLREAVRLDPKFALSWALLSYVDSRGYLTESLQPTVALREEARQAAETALTLQPNLGEAVLAKGAYHYFCLKDYDTAVRYFEQARQFLPNISRIPESLAYVARRRGQWDRSESFFNEAERLDPRNVLLLTQRAQSYNALRRFPEALRKPD